MELDLGLAEEAQYSLVKHQFAGSRKIVHRPSLSDRCEGLPNALQTSES